MWPSLYFRAMLSFLFYNAAKKKKIGPLTQQVAFSMKKVTGFRLKVAKVNR